MTDDLNDEGLKDQIKGTVKEGEGHLRDAVGGLTGDTSEQIKGKGQQLKGKIQRKIGETESDADRDL
ncbi:MAG TPA: CsbD family protein [Gemmatimonadaceae bacterium]|nr:CsbD family protein [Gemmatimonadaceae bacterium]